MGQRPHYYQIGLVTAGGVHLEYDSEGWRILNIRQLGEAARAAALELLDQAAACAESAVVDPLDPNPLLARAEQVAVRFALRITHRRAKQKRPW